MVRGVSQPAFQWWSARLAYDSVVTACCGLELEQHVCFLSSGLAAVKQALWTRAGLQGQTDLTEQTEQSSNAETGSGTAPKSVCPMLPLVIWPRLLQICHLYDHDERDTACFILEELQNYFSVRSYIAM